MPAFCPDRRRQDAGCGDECLACEAWCRRFCLLEDRLRLAERRAEKAERRAARGGGEDCSEIAEQLQQAHKRLREIDGKIEECKEADRIQKELDEANEELAKARQGLAEEQAKARRRDDAARVKRKREETEVKVQEADEECAKLKAELERVAGEFESHKKRAFDCKKFKLEANRKVADLWKLHEKAALEGVEKDDTDKIRRLIAERKRASEKTDDPTFQKEWDTEAASLTEMVELMELTREAKIEENCSKLILKRIGKVADELEKAKATRGELVKKETKLVEEMARTPAVPVRSEGASSEQPARDAPAPVRSEGASSEQPSREGAFFEAKAEEEEKKIKRLEQELIEVKAGEDVKDLIEKKEKCQEELKLWMGKFTIQRLKFEAAIKKISDQKDECCNERDACNKAKRKCDEAFRGLLKGVRTGSREALPVAAQALDCEASVNDLWSEIENLWTRKKDCEDNMGELEKELKSCREENINLSECLESIKKMVGAEDCDNIKEAIEKLKRKDGEENDPAHNPNPNPGRGSEVQPEKYNLGVHFDVPKELWLRPERDPQDNRERQAKAFDEFLKWTVPLAQSQGDENPALLFQNQDSGRGLCWSGRVNNAWKREKTYIKDRMKKDFERLKLPQEATEGRIANWKVEKNVCSPDDTIKERLIRHGQILKQRRESFDQLTKQMDDMMNLVIGFVQGKPMTQMPKGDNIARKDERIIMDVSAGLKEDLIPNLDSAIYQDIHRNLKRWPQTFPWHEAAKDIVVRLLTLLKVVRKQYSTMSDKNKFIQNDYVEKWYDDLVNRQQQYSITPDDIQKAHGILKDNFKAPSDAPVFWTGQST